MKKFILTVLTFLTLTTTTFAANIPTLNWPLEKTTTTTIVRNFGYSSPFHGTGLTHYNNSLVGVDIKATALEEVFAVEDGIVKLVRASSSIYPGLVVLEHTDTLGSKYTTLYYGINTLPLTLGDVVVKGQAIGNVFNLGVDTNLHFGIRNSSYSFTNSVTNYLYTYIYGPGAASVKVRFPELWVDPNLYLLP